MNEKLLLQDLVVLLANKANITQKDADRFYRELVQLILDCIYDNEQVKIKSFGTFKLVPISSRESVDVNTGEKIEIPAHYRLSFVADKVLKDAVNEPFSHFESVLLDDEIDYSSNITKEVLEKQDKGDNESTIKDSKIVVESIEDDGEEESYDEDGDDVEILEEETLPTEVLSRSRTSRYAIPPIGAEEALETASKNTIKKEETKRTIEPIDILSRSKTTNSSSGSSPRATSNLLDRKEKVDSPKEIKEDKLEIIEPRRSRLPLIEKDEPIEKKTPVSIVDIELNSLTSRSLSQSKSIDNPAPIVEPVVKSTVSSVVVEPLSQPVLGKKQDTPDLRNPLESESEIVEAGRVPKIEEEPVLASVPDNWEHILSGEQSDFDYSYENPENYTWQTKLKKRWLVVVVAILIGAFAIYQYSKLFDVKYDYEYYINQPLNLTLTDTLPYLDEKNVRKAVTDTTSTQGASASDTVLSRADGGQEPIEERAQVVSQNRPSPRNNGEPSFNEEPTDLDSLFSTLESENSLEGRVYNVSHNLQLKVVNKAELYQNKQALRNKSVAE